jgi:uncharacterized protein YndB with AHSA1/START domain
MSDAPTTILEMARVFNAPRETVYRAFLDPDQLSMWFGPVGYTVPKETIDIEPLPGGHFNLVMVNEENPEETSPIAATVTELVENEVLEGQEEWEGTTLTMRLEFRDEAEGATKVALRQGPFPRGMGDDAREGWSSSFDKLDALLASMAA